MASTLRHVVIDLGNLISAIEYGNIAREDIENILRDIQELVADEDEFQKQQQTKTD